MKAHVMLALGLLLGAVFALRLAMAVAAPGFGWNEAYLAGGVALSAWLVMGGIAEWRHARALKANEKLDA